MHGIGTFETLLLFARASIIIQSRNKSKPISNGCLSNQNRIAVFWELLLKVNRFSIQNVFIRPLWKVLFASFPFSATYPHTKKLYGYDTIDDFIIYLYLTLKFGLSVESAQFCFFFRSSNLFRLLFDSVCCLLIVVLFVFVSFSPTLSFLIAFALIYVCLRHERNDASMIAFN